MDNKVIGEISGIIDIGGFELPISMLKDGGIFSVDDIRNALVEEIENILGKKLPYGVAQLGNKPLSFFVLDMKYNYLN